MGELVQHAFISFDEKDAREADVVQAALEAAKIRVWRATSEVLPGDSWRDRIRTAISVDALVFLACFSRASLARARAQQYEELTWAVGELRQRHPETPWLIPVRFDDCEIPDLDLGAGRSLRDLRLVDAFGPQRTEELQRLVTAITRAFAKGTIRPARERPAGGHVPADPIYLQQVRRIAPPVLYGRDEELAELAAFCTEPDLGPYIWWRAGPWAGKSALLSTFVLRPPTEIASRIRVVSFFITARLAAHDTREAFTEVIGGQLARLAGHELPAALPESTRDAVLLDLLAQAAQSCQDMGERLVLVVDGLDEDRSVTSGPDAHSIAGLLPPDPPHGMKVIVAGRPDPPIPDDVPGWHPLRDQAIVRPLKASAYAEDAGRLARQELHRLLGGIPLERDVLALITAARGGLAAADLTELSAAPLWEVEEVLRAPNGRTFASRPAQYFDDTEVYLLGHEELQSAATYYLATQLPAYYDRLHEWAVKYQEKGWPADTPEYLVAGYFQLLDSLSDLPRMSVLAGNPARHDRMLDITGGDGPTLAEIRTVLDRIATGDAPDIADALHLAWHRDQLADRNLHIPEALPAIWVSLGKPARGQALAGSITDPYRRSQVLARMADALAAAGKFQVAEETAGSITDLPAQWEALARVVGQLAGAGQCERAEDLPARSSTRSGRTMRWHRWPARWLRPGSASEPRIWPARSSTRSGRTRRWRKSPGPWPAPGNPSELRISPTRSSTPTGKRGRWHGSLSIRTRGPTRRQR
jgi:hypothetical protein